MEKATRFHYAYDIVPEMKGVLSTVLSSLLNLLIETPMCPGRGSHRQIENKDLSTLKFNFPWETERLKKINPEYFRIDSVLKWML